MDRVLSALVYCLGGQAENSENAPGAVLTTWLDAFNSGDRAKPDVYLRRYQPERVSQIDESLQFREQTSGFTFIRIEKSETNSLEAIMKEREGGNYARLSLEITDADHPAVTHLDLHIVPRPSDEPAVPRLTCKGAIEAVDSRATELAAKEQFSGCVLVARAGKISLEKAYGLAGRDRHLETPRVRSFGSGR